MNIKVAGGGNGKTKGKIRVNHVNEFKLHSNETKRER